jgi:hypothetical protein
MNLETAVVVTASTAHVLKEEANPDDPTTLYGRSIWPSEYGFFVYIGLDNPDDSWPNLDDYPDEPSEGLLAVIALARASGATWLRLDQDGPVLDNIPSYDW